MPPKHGFKVMTSPGNQIPRIMQMASESLSLTEQSHNITDDLVKLVRRQQASETGPDGQRGQVRFEEVGRGRGRSRIETGRVGMRV